MPPEVTDQALKKARSSHRQTAHRTPGKSSPSNRKIPNRNSASPTPGATTEPQNSLVSDEDTDSDETHTNCQNPIPSFNPVPHLPNNALIDVDIMMEEENEPDSHPSTQPPPHDTPPPVPEPNRAPSLNEERSRTSATRSVENPHKTNFNAVEIEEPSDVLFYSNLEKIFVKNAGQFPRITLDAPFILKGQDKHIAETVRKSPDQWLAVVPAMGGHYTLSRIPHIFELITDALAEAGCGTLITLSTTPPPLTKQGHEQRGRGRNSRGRTRGRGNSNIPMSTSEPTNRGHFDPPYAAFIKVESTALRNRLIRQQTFTKSKVVTFHIIPVINDTHRNWTVGQFWTTIKKYDDDARVGILFALKSTLFEDKAFRNKIQTISTATGNLDAQVLDFLDTFDLELQNYFYKPPGGGSPQQRWVLYAAPVSMNEDREIRETQEEDIRSYIRQQRYAYDIYIVEGTTMHCALCKANNHNRFACPFTTHKDWQGPNAEEAVKDVVDAFKKSQQAPKNN
ncbi:MAG: hypothetical protein NXY57DRAFT_962123 [Lentinula lateritia]|nr:MAG: hypothetical protein NXY57DRAFT_962123 [Lentinula lateritia]